MKSDYFVGFINDIQSKANALVLEFEKDYRNKKGRDLSDEEKFAIGFCSGLKIEKVSGPEESNGNYSVKIHLEKSAVEWDGTKFLVAKIENIRAEVGDVY